MTKTNIKLNIQQDQLKWFLAILLNEREISQLLKQSDPVIDLDTLQSSSKQEILNKFVTAFVKQFQIDEIVVEHLSQKAATAISRVGFMEVDEIHNFFKTPESLFETGEFGEVVWALLIDSREDVSLHGYNLISQAYEHRKSPNDDNVQQNTTNLPNQPQITTSESQVIPAENKSEFGVSQNELDNQQSEIGKLEQALSNLREQYSTLGKKNKRLELHCQYLLEENEGLKGKVNTFVEKEKELVLLQQENKVLHENSILYAETNDKLLNLDKEHKQLIAKYDEISTQLNELGQIKASKESFMVELKLVEEAVYNEKQTLDQLKADIQGHFDMFEKSHEISQNALNQIRQTVSYINVSDVEIIADSEIESAQPRVGVFVDVQNMFYAAKDRFERRVDYIKLLDLIVGPRQLITAYAYIVQIPEIKQGNFISLLEHNGYTIRSKDLRLRGDGSAKGDWDVGIAVDVVSMLGKLDVVILASGDGDFCPLADLIKQQNKRIEVVAFEHNTSMDLQTMADQFFPIGEELLM